MSKNVYAVELMHAKEDGMTLLQRSPRHISKSKKKRGVTRVTLKVDKEEKDSLLAKRTLQKQLRYHYYHLEVLPRGIPGQVGILLPSVQACRAADSRIRPCELMGVSYTENI